MNDLRYVDVAYIVTTAEKLWQALTDGAFTDRYWFGCRVTSDWQVGSKVEIFMPDGQLANTGVVVESDPPRRLTYTWHVEFHEKFRQEASSRVRYEIEPLSEVVKLTVIHDQFPDGSAVFQSISKGWPKVVSSLKSFLESGSSLAIASSAAACTARQEAVEAAPTTTQSEQPGSVFVSYIASTPEKVWQALTDCQFTQQYFFGRRMQSDWKAGSPWKMSMEDGRIDSCGTVLASEPPHKLSISWRVEWIEEMRTLPEARVEFQIAAVGDVTQLTVLEFHHPSLDEKYKEGGRQGWPIILSGLKSLLETGHALPTFPLPGRPAK